LGGPHPVQPSPAQAAGLGLAMTWTGGFHQHDPLISLDVFPGLNRLLN